eukprot:11208554-Lingulodinium_polyedra.AAC.1
MNGTTAATARARSPSESEVPAEGAAADAVEDGAGAAIAATESTDVSLTPKEVEIFDIALVERYG